LIDFGAVKELANSSYQSSRRGEVLTTYGPCTPGYVAPEQMRGKPQPASDIYAVGVIAVQALTGKNPTDFCSDDNGKLLWEDEVNVSSEFKPFLARMLADNVLGRYSNAGEALKELNTLNHLLYSSQKTIPVVRLSSQPREVKTIRSRNIQKRNFTNSPIVRSLIFLIISLLGIKAFSQSFIPDFLYNFLYSPRVQTILFLVFMGFTPFVGELSCGLLFCNLILLLIILLFSPFFGLPPFWSSSLVTDFCILWIATVTGLCIRAILMSLVTSND
jgi:serine/threonine protein kinase